MQTIIVLMLLPALCGTVALFSLSPFGHVQLAVPVVQLGLIWFMTSVDCRWWGDNVIMVVKGRCKYEDKTCSLGPYGSVPVMVQKPLTLTELRQEAYYYVKESIPPAPFILGSGFFIGVGLTIYGITHYFMHGSIEGYPFLWLAFGLFLFGFTVGLFIRLID